MPRHATPIPSQVPGNEFILREGELRKCIYIVITGEVEVGAAANPTARVCRRPTLVVPRRRPQVTDRRGVHVKTLRRGEHFGELSALDILPCEKVRV